MTGYRNQATALRCHIQCEQRSLDEPAGSTMAQQHVVPGGERVIHRNRFTMITHNTTDMGNVGVRCQSVSVCNC